MRNVSRIVLIAAIIGVTLNAVTANPPPEKKVKIGANAPNLMVKDPSGKVINLADLTAKGPVLLRLTCGCSGCDKELKYFKTIHNEYKKSGLISLLVFREPDAKVEKYAKDKKLNMLYAVDAKGKSFQVFETKTMPTNFLIGKGGKIIAIAAGCDPSGFLANKVSEKVANTVGTQAVDVKNKNKEIKRK